MEAQTWPWNERINSIFLYDSYLMCVWFIFACLVFPNIDDMLHGNEILQPEESINRVTGNSSSLGEK